jgi:RHS repeat-associated protein
MVPYNAVPNAGFEQGTQGWSLQFGAQLVTDSSRAHSGSGYAQLSTSGTQAIVAAPSVPARPGEQVTFGGWAYRESGTSGSLRWKLAVWDSNFNAITYPDPSPNNVTSASWIYQVGSYTVPSNAAYVELYAEIYNATSATVARFDDGFLGFGAVPGSGPLYYVEDSLGTSRLVTSGGGVVCYDADFYPYGGERPYTNTCPQNYKFEGKERDTETGNDDFGARYYSNRFGRWLSSDWSAVPVAVPYANLTNPQTLNLYSMVADDPESFADLDGHDSLDNQRRSAVRQAWKQEQQLVATTGRGTVDWTPAQKAELLQTGKVSGFEGHHINNVADHPELAGNPNNIKFVEGRAGNLAEHGGNFQNATSGELMSRTSVAMIALGVVVDALRMYSHDKQSGIHEGFFTGQLSIVDPANAAKSLNGLVISVRGKDGNDLYRVNNGQFVRYGCQGNDCVANPNDLKGKTFRVLNPRNIA